MSTTISPSAGNAVLWTQQGAGTSPGYSALDRRRATNAALQEGVIGPLDFKVAQRAAGANMSVDIGMPAGGEALVQGDAVTGQGLYTVPCHSATVNEAVTAAHATLPRIDQVLLRVRDNTHDASGVNAADVFVLAGVATSGATLDNRTGAAVVPGSCMRLADVLVPAASTTVATANISDRRPWARGALFASTYEATNFTFGTALSQFGGPAVNPILEVSSGLIHVALSLQYTASAIDQNVYIRIRSNSNNAGQVELGYAEYSVKANFGLTINYNAILPIPAGRTIFSVWGATNTGIGTISSGAGQPFNPRFSIRESINLSAVNG